MNADERRCLDDMGRRKSQTGNRPEWVYLRSAANPEGAVLEKEQACIPPDDRGFMFADGVYEVIRGYSGRLLLPDKHLGRFKHSLDAIRIAVPEVFGLARVARELLARNGLERADALVYVQVTRGAWPRMLGFPTTPLVPTVYVAATRLALPEDEMEHGIAAITVPDTRWARCDIKWLGLLPNVLARQQAAEAGADEAVFIRDGIITEGSHSTIFGVSGGTVTTHPLDNHILPGITREIVLDVCRRLDIPVSETAIPETRMPEMDEMFLACTTGEVTPITMVNGRPISDARPGPVTRRLQQAFREYVDDALRLAHRA